MANRIEDGLEDGSPESVLAVIPARYASTRFPGKPLADIAGKPMIQHVWERVCAVPDIARVLIATDDARIAQAARAFGADVRMTSPAHASGTDRVWEAAEPLPQYGWILNVQGDEPLIQPDMLAQVVQAARRSAQADIVTLVTPIRSAAEWDDPNVVKAVVAADGRALYFSRAGIPFARDAGVSSEACRYRHIGLYLYRRAVLARLTALAPSPLERLECLEQLRALEAGMRIQVAVVADAAPGVDTPEDLNRLQSGIK